MSESKTLVEEDWLHAIDKSLELFRQVGTGKRLLLFLERQFHQAPTLIHCVKFNNDKMKPKV